MRDRMMTGRMIINEKYDNRYGFYVKVDNILILYLLKKYQYFYLFYKTLKNSNLVNK